MSIMSILLPQAAGSLTKGLGMAPGDNNINVDGSAPGIKDYILEDTRAAPTEDEIGEIIPREGLLGTKGTLRDVLGTLGDMFLVQSGNRPMYAPMRDREKIGDAMYGFSQNPVQAIERLAAAGYSAEARELAEMHSQNMARQSQNSSRATRDQAYTQNVNSQIEQRRAGIADDLRDFGSRLLGEANDDNLTTLYDTIEGLATRNGLSLEDLGISRDMTPEEAKTFARSGLTASQRSQEESRAARLAIQQSEARSRNANREDQRRSRRSRDSDSRRRADAYVNKQGTSTGGRTIADWKTLNEGN